MKNHGIFIRQVPLLFRRRTRLGGRQHRCVPQARRALLPRHAARMRETRSLLRRLLEVPRQPVDLQHVPRRRHVQDGTGQRHDQRCRSGTEVGNRFQETFSRNRLLLSGNRLATGHGQLVMFIFCLCGNLFPMTESEGLVSRSRIHNWASVCLSVCVCLCVCVCHLSHSASATAKTTRDREKSSKQKMFLFALRFILPPPVISP